MSAKPSENIDAIACGAVTDRVSVTVAHYADGWGFHGWSSADGEAIAAARFNAADLACRFSTPRQAIAHCRAVYHRRLMIVPEPAALPDWELERLGRRVQQRVFKSRSRFYSTYEKLRERLDARLKRRLW